MQNNEIPIKINSNITESLYTGQNRKITEPRKTRSLLQIDYPEVHSGRMHRPPPAHPISDHRQVNLVFEDTVSRSPPMPAPGENRKKRFSPVPLRIRNFLPFSLCAHAAGPRRLKCEFPLFVDEGSGL